MFYQNFRHRYLDKSDFVQLEKDQTDPDKTDFDPSEFIQSERDNTEQDQTEFDQTEYVQS